MRRLQWGAMGLGRAALSLLLATSMAGSVPTSALAAEVAAQTWEEALEASEAIGYDEHAYASSDEDASLLSDEASSYPSKFDLRNVTEEDAKASYTSITKAGNYVTPVKYQNPWGVCWAFAIIAASETSILTDSGLTYEDTLADESDHTSGLDLSERHLAYFGNSYVTDNEDGQYGEGRHSYSSNPDLNYRMVAGQLTFGTTTFASGTGPVYEEFVPYKNEEGAITYYVMKDGAVEMKRTLTPQQITKLQAEGYTVTMKCYADYIYVDNGTNTPSDNDSKKAANWTVDEDLRYKISFELEESNLLPDMREYDSEGNYTGYSKKALDAVKKELLDGHAVSVKFYADASLPNQESSSVYINTNTWAHYTYKKEDINHGVTIVGYDDNYPAENFSYGYTGEEAEKRTPPGDGAFIVKNSWGAETEEFPNYNDWGIEDAGKSTGYFYISYYDQSLDSMETFDFDLTEYSNNDSLSVMQYDYLTSNADLVSSYSFRAPEANVFTAEADTQLRTLTCQTAKPNTEVTYEVYLLDDDAENPEDGTPAYSNASNPEFYDMSGFHRLTLPEESWIPMREGQRYSVVVTQRCTDDGLYYQSSGRNAAKLSDETIAGLKQFYASMYTSELQASKYNELYAQYIKDGKSEDEAKELATSGANEYINSEKVQAEITKKVETIMQGALTTYYKGVVNEGESYSYCTNASNGGTVEWAEWSGEVERLKDTPAGLNSVFDNFPIKSYAELTDYASLDSLSGLQAAIDAAEGELASYVVSADGSDVAAGTKWVTQEAYDALAAAIAEARALMTAAGSDWATTLASTTPAQEEVDGGLSTLASAREAYAAAAKDGTKAAPVAQVPPSAAQQTSKGGGRLAQTGDNSSSLLAVAVVALLVGVAAIAAGIFVARRHQKSLEGPKS